MSKRTRVLSIDVGIVNLAYCIIDFYDSTSFNLVHVEKARIGSMKMNSQTLLKNVIEYFRRSAPIRQQSIDVILIESQMSRAIKNCILAHVIMSFFYTEIREKCPGLRDVKHMSFVRPWKKFEAVKIAFESSGCLKNVDFERSPSCSRRLKKLSIEIAKTIFVEFQVLEGLRAIEEYRPKIDDICDVFLQSFVTLLLPRLAREHQTDNEHQEKHSEEVTVVPLDTDLKNVHRFR